MRNLSVIACDPCNGFYYPGFVTQFTEYATTTVRFYCRRQLEVPTDQIIPIGGAVPWPHLQLWDFALVRVYFRTLHEEAYVPAQVLVLPQTSNTFTKYYSLRLYNGLMVHKPRRFIVKIAKEKFEVIVDTILEIRRRNQPRQVARSGRRLTRRTRQTPLVLHRPVPVNKQRTTVFRELQRIRTFGTRIPRNTPVVRRPRRSFSAGHILDVIGSSNLSSSSKSSKSRNDVIKSTDDVMNATDGDEPNDTVVVQELEDSYSDDTFEDSGSSSSKSTIKWRNELNAIKGASIRERVEKSDSPVRSTSSGSSKDKRSRSPLSMNTSTSSISRNRKSRKIETGQEVLARWPDDGWYYFCCVVTEIDDERFVLRDSTGLIETIAGDDILTEAQQSFDVIQPGDHVIGLHPNFLFSYAPAVVRDVYGLGVRVEFFDCTEARLPFEEVYKLTPDKYKQDTGYIQVCAERVCKTDGGNVVARDDATGFYTRCFAECPASRSNFITRMLNGTYRKQAAIHVFERTPALSSYKGTKDGWQYMLVPVDDAGSDYLPAVILQQFPLAVKFADGSNKTLGSLKDCFYLNERYYKNAVDFFIEKRARNPVSPGRVVNGW